MMKKLLRVLIPAILMLVLPAAAQYNDPCGVFRDQNCNPIVENPDDMGTGGTVAKMYYCSAKGTWGGACADCLTGSNGTTGCGLVQWSAYCKCDPPCKADTRSSCSYAP